MLFLAFYGKKTFFKIFQNWSKLFFPTNFIKHYMFKLLKTQKYAWKMVVYVISELWKTPPLSHPASHIWDACSQCHSSNMTQDIKNLRNHFLDYITNFKFCSYTYTKLCLNSLLQAYVIDDLLISGFWQNFIQNGFS